MAVDDKFTELVLREADVPPERMEEALHRQLTSGTSFDLVLLEMGLLSEDQALEFLSRATGLPAVGREEINQVDPGVVMMFPRRLAEKHGIAPLDLSGRRLSVAVHRLPDLGLLDDIGFMLSVYIRPFVTTSARIEYGLHRLYTAPISPRVENLLGMWGEDTDEKPTADVGKSKTLAARLNDLAANEAASISSRTAAASLPVVDTASVSPPISDAETEALVAGLSGGVPEADKFAAAGLSPVVDSTSPAIATDASVVAPSQADEGDALDASDELDNVTFAPAPSVSTSPDATEARPTGNAVDSEDGWRVVSSGAALRSATGADAPQRAQAEGNILTSTGGDDATTSNDAALSAPPNVDEQRAAQALVNARLDEEEERERAGEEARRNETVRWTVDDAIAELALADGRDAMVDVLLRFARRRLPTAAMFVLQRDASGESHFVGWDVISAAWSRDEFRRVTISATGNGALAKLASMQSPFLGPLQEDDPLTEVWGRAPRASLLVPVMVGDQLAGAVYGDCGPKSIPPSSLAELHMVVPRLGKGLRNLIVRSKRRAATSETVESESKVDDIMPAAALLSEQPAIELDVDFDEVSEPNSPAPALDDLQDGPHRVLTPPAHVAPSASDEGKSGPGDVDPDATSLPASSFDSPAEPSASALALGAKMGFVEPPPMAAVPMTDPEGEIAADDGEQPSFLIGDDVVVPQVAEGETPPWADHGPLMEPLKRPVDPAFVYTRSGPNGSPLEVIEAPDVDAKVAPESDTSNEETHAESDDGSQQASSHGLGSDATSGDVDVERDDDEDADDSAVAARVIGFDDEEDVEIDAVVLHSVTDGIQSTPATTHAPVDLGVVIGSPLPTDFVDDDDDDDDDGVESADEPAASANVDTENNDDDDDDDGDDWEDGEESIDASVLQIEEPKIAPASDNALDAGLFLGALVPEDQPDEALVADDGDDDAVAADDNRSSAPTASDSEPENESTSDGSEIAELTSHDSKVAELTSDDSSSAESASDDSSIAEPASDGSPVAESASDRSPVAESASDRSPVAKSPDVDGGDDDNSVESTTDSAVDGAVQKGEAKFAAGLEAANADVEPPAAMNVADEDGDDEPVPATRPLPPPTDPVRDAGPASLTIVDEDTQAPVFLRRFTTTPDVSATEDTAPKPAAEGDGLDGLDFADDIDAQADEFEVEDSEGERPVITGVVIGGPEEITESSEVAKADAPDVSIHDIDALDAAFRRKSEGHPVAPGPAENEEPVPLPGAEALEQPATTSPVPAIADEPRDPNKPPPLPRRKPNSPAPDASPPATAVANIIDPNDAAIHEATTLPPQLRSCAPSPGAGARESVLLATWRNWMQHEDPEMDALLADLQQPGEIGRSAVVKIADMGDQAMPSLARYFPGVLQVHPFGPMDARPDVGDFSDALAVLNRVGADAAAPILTAEVRHDDRLHRYAAVWALSQLKVPSTLPRLAERVFDPEWRIALLAIDVLQTYTKVPAFARLLVELRKYVGKGDEFQRKRAILAVSELRDREALPLLVDLLGTRPKTIAEEARRALVDVTKQDFGSSGRRWRAWLADNQSRSRVDWLIDGLAHKDSDIRNSSHLELERLTQNFIAFRHDGPRQEREAAIAQWRQWWSHQDASDWP